MTRPSRELVGHFARLREGWIDLGLGLAAALIGSVSLLYPFCRDQGLFQYVGRQWFLQGQLPYRDVFDHKTPFIFFVNGIFVTLFGEGILPVRIAEWLLVLAIGPLAVLASTPKDAPPRAGVIGLTALTTVLFYFGSFPYPDTANCEIWAVAMLLFALVLVNRRPAARSTALSVGVLSGLAFLAKPPSGAFIAAVGLVLMARTPAWRDRARTLAVLAATFSAPIALTLLYFAAKGGLFDFWDVVVNVNRYYVQSEGVVHTGWHAIEVLLTGVLWFAPVGTVFFLGSGAVASLALVQGRRDVALRYAAPFAYGVCALVVVWMQRKFFVYHYTFLTFGIALFAARAFDDVLAKMGDVRRARLAIVPLGAALVLLFHTGGRPMDELERRLREAVAYERGALTREAYERTFDIPGFYDNGNVMAVSRWLAENTKATDRVLVRGYEPEIYLLAKRQFGGRFFWSVFITTSWRSYRREEWLAQDREQLERIRPDYVVALPPQPDPPRDDWFLARAKLESSTWFEERGYAEVTRFGAFIVLRRGDLAAR
jgi:hypothetical protein